MSRCAYDVSILHVEGSLHSILYLGRVLAEMNIFIVIVACLSTVTFLKAKDQNGDDIEPELEWTGTLTT
jgi:hypothetical protein